MTIVTRVALELGRECPGVPLVVPLLHPGRRAEGLEVLEEKLAGLVVLALQVDASVVVHIVLPAVPVP